MGSISYALSFLKKIIFDVLPPVNWYFMNENRRNHHSEDRCERAFELEGPRQAGPVARLSLPGAVASLG